MNNEHANPEHDAKADAEAAAELQLLDRIDAGDRDAMAALLTLYQPRLFGVCVRMVPDAERAEDLVQDAFVKILRGLETFDRRSKLSTWMIRVTMNVCLSWLRAEKHRRHASLEAGSGPGPNVLRSSPRDRLAYRQEQTGIQGHAGVEPDAWAGVQQGAERRESAALVSSALSSIPEESRAILVLRDVQGLDYQQIADVLGLAVGTVKSRLFRARAALRAKVEAMEAGEDAEKEPAEKTSGTPGNKHGTHTDNDGND